MPKRTPVPPTDEHGAHLERDAGREWQPGERRFARGPDQTQPVEGDRMYEGERDTRRGSVPLGAEHGHEHGRRGGKKKKAFAGLALGGLMARRRNRRHRRGAAGTGATAATHGTRKRRGGFLLPLLGLLLLIGLVVLAAALLSGNDKDSSEGSGTPAQEQRDGGSGSGSAAGAGAGALQIDGKPVQPGADLGGLVDRRAEVTGAKVVQVDGDSGFFIGSGKDQRTFVEYGPAAGTDEATQMPKVGDTVDLSGPVAEPPKQPGRTFHIPVSSEKIILEQGGYINADRVTPTR